MLLRCVLQAGDYAVVEEPTYFLSHTMMRDRGITNLLGVPMQPDGLDLDALEAHCKEQVHARVPESCMHALVLDVRTRMYLLCAFHIPVRVCLFACCERTGEPVIRC